MSSRSTVELTTKTMNHYLVKRTKAHIWDFKTISGPDNAKNLRALKSALRSSKNVQKLALEYKYSKYDIFPWDRAKIFNLEISRPANIKRYCSLSAKVFGDSLRSKKIHLTLRGNQRTETKVYD